VGIRIPAHAERYRPLGELHQEITIPKFGKAHFAVRRQAQESGPVELDFRPAILFCENVIPFHQRRVQICSHELAGIAAPHRHIAADHADSRHTVVRSISRLRFVCFSVNRNRH
jgi:hypothetical protein